MRADMDSGATQPVDGERTAVIYLYSKMELVHWTSLKQAIEGRLIFRDEFSIFAHGVVSYIHVNIGEDFKGFLKAFESSREKITPLETLQLGSATEREMDHFSDIGVIPAPEGDARDEVFVIDEAKCLRGEETGIVVAEVMQSDPRLAESVDSTDRADDSIGQQRESRAG
jgi:hypothetical protein